MAYIEPGKMPLHQVKVEPVDDSGEDSEPVCGGNENEDDEDMAVPDPTSMLSVRFEEEEPSNLKISIDPAPTPPVLGKDHYKDDERQLLSQTSGDGSVLVTSQLQNLEMPAPVTSTGQKHWNDVNSGPLMSKVEEADPRFSIHIHSQREDAQDLTGLSLQRKDLPLMENYVLATARRCPNRHEEERFKCSLCKRVFTKQEHLDIHLCVVGRLRPRNSVSQLNSTVKVMVERTIVCVVCMTTFASQHELDTHYAKAHGSVDLGAGADGTSRKTVQPDAQGIFICHYCQMAFPSRKDLNVHRTQEHQSARAKHSCTDCGRAFLRPVELFRHQRTAHSDGEEAASCMFKCPQCGKQLTTRPGFERHVATHDANALKHECADCGRRFYDRARLNVHRRIHTGERPYECRICGHRFRQQPCLIRHLRTHAVDTGSVPLSVARPHSCPECGKGFSNTSHMAIHMRTHTGEKPYECAYCGRRFSDKAHLLRHMAALHPDPDAPHRCSDCGKVFADKARLEDHERVHRGERPFECLVCHRNFTSIAYLRVHAECHREKAACPYCHKAYARKYRLTVHIRKAHPGEIDSTVVPYTSTVDAVDLPPTAAETETQKPALYLCDKCPNAFKTETEFITHVESHKVRKAHPCDKCEKSFNRKSELNVHSRTHCEVKPFACHLCEKTFAQKNNLLRHLRTHSGEKPFPCSLCSRTFAQKELLTAHIRIHTGERPYSCLVCGQAFNQRHTLTRHVREHANRDTAKAFSCSLCGKTFPRQVNLDIHMRTHTGERPFECELCSKRFSQSGHLARHKLTHTGKTPYPCPICGKGFSQKKRLVDHARTHTGERPFGCHYCPKSFTHAEYLKSHLHTHREEKYVCPVCREMFSRKYRLKEHMRIHSSEWPLQCAHCKACFVSKEDIADHIHSRHLSVIMGDSYFPVEKSHTSSDEPESQPYCKTENEDTDGRRTGTPTAGFALPCDEENLQESDFQLEITDEVLQKHDSPENTSAISDRVSIFIKEERILDEEDLACSADNWVSTAMPPQIFVSSAPITQTTFIIKDEKDTPVEDALCLGNDTELNTSEPSIASVVGTEIKLSAITKENIDSSLGKYPYMGLINSAGTSNEKEIANIKTEATADNEYHRFQQNEGMQESIVSGSVKTSNSSDKDVFTNPECLHLESDTTSIGQLGTLVSDLSGKTMTPVSIKEELSSREEYPLCMQNDAVCKTVPMPLAPDVSRNIHSVTNFSESIAAEMQWPLYLGKDTEHKTLPPPSSSSAREQLTTNEEGPLCLKSRTVSENLALNIFQETSSGTKWSTTIQNPISSSEVPPCSSHDIGSKGLAVSSVSSVHSDMGLRVGTEGYLVPNSRHSSYFANSSMCRTVTAHLTSNCSQKMKKSDIIKEDRLTTSDHPLCLERDAASDDLPPSCFPNFVNKTKASIRIRKDLMSNLEPPLCLKRDVQCQRLQDTFVSDVRKITESFPLPLATTLTVSAPGDKETCNMSDTLVSYQQMLYDKLMSSPSVFQE
ncbi:zinc finger protein 845-like [Schistocerca gregaria]|uniref:zinc finger protein 845-like n=1 Tax=Schistocerca gregaria TaxID=7010 RepID=UPI00211E8C6C|nr:zinc finger protein 845-like [Schistocerca gregaria]